MVWDGSAETGGDRHRRGERFFHGYGRTVDTAGNVGAADNDESSVGERYAGERTDYDANGTSSWDGHAEADIRDRGDVKANGHG